MRLAVEIDPDYAWSLEAQLEGVLGELEEGG
jgi:hypothetical protein